jgi:hypothetical protein
MKVAGRTGFGSVAGIQLMAMGATAVALLAWNRWAGSGRPAPTSLVGGWQVRRAELEARLARHPDDDGARLRLARVLFHVSLAKAQETDPTPAWESTGQMWPYRQHVAGCLSRAAETDAARAAADQVAAGAASPELRAAAWEFLALQAATLGDKARQLSCVRQSYRASPNADRREAVRALYAAAGEE